MSSSPPVLSASTSLWTQPLTLGELNLKNRILVAPTTRNRGNIPGPAQAAYYAARASAGLIVSEATLPVPQGYEFSNAPGIYSRKQIAGWKTVTDAVHAAGGLIVNQIMNIGRVAHPVLQAGQQNYGPSPIASKGGKFKQLNNYKYVSSTHDVLELTEDSIGYVTPEGIEDPWTIVAEFKRAFQNSKEAGFDGVEVHGANGYLVAQFFDLSSNQRQDEWGGSPEKRGKFALEVLKVAIEVWGSGRVGIKLTPEGGYNDQGQSTQETLDTFKYFLSEAEKLHLAYVHIQRWFPDFDAAKRGTIISQSTWRQLYHENLLLNGAFTPAEGLASLSSNEADAILFGRDWIANPDLVDRILQDLPLNAFDWGTSYLPGPHGYSDYPLWSELTDEQQDKLRETWSLKLAQHEKTKVLTEQLLEKQNLDEKRTETGNSRITISEPNS